MSGLLLALWASETRAAPVLSADIPPQSMASALAEFAQQAGLQVIYVSKIAKTRSSKGARAGLTPAEALPMLLNGTGLDFEFLNERTVRIFEATPTGVSAPPKGAAPPPHSGPRAPWLGNPDEEIVVVGVHTVSELMINEDMQNEPASVSILGGEQLGARKLEQLSDYAAYLPGVSFSGLGAPGSAALTFRGVGTAAASGSYYLDDTPVGANGSWGAAGGEVLDIMPYDLERLEVWRGPQGTHYGADSVSGLIRFVLKPPSLSGLEARVGADGGMVQGAAKVGGSIRAMLNTPIIPDRLAMRVNGYDSYTPGYIDNAYDGARDVNPVRQSGARFALLWRPAASLSVKVTAYWPRIHSESEADVSSTGVANVPGTGDAYILRPTGFYGDLTDHHAFLQPFRKSIDYYAASLHWVADPFEMDSATAWSRTQSHSVFDTTLVNGASFPDWSNGAVAAGLSVFHRDVGVEKFSEELRLTSPAGRRFEWLLGGFYTHESVSDLWTTYAYDYNYQPIAAFAPVAFLTTVNNTFTELASFGELTWHVTERFDLAGGIRYAHSDQQFTAIDSGVLDVPALTTGRSSEGVTTWMSAASYHFTSDVMLYGRVATGSQPSSLNGTLPGVPPTAKGETVTNHEVGVKSELLEHKALVDLSLYYNSINDVQLGRSDDNCYCVVSGGNAVAKGLELTTSYAPFGGLKLALGAAYVHSVLTSFTPEAGTQTALLGYQVPDLPKWSYAFTADYDWALSDLWYAHAGGAFRWAGARWAEQGVQSRSLGGGPTMDLPPYELLDLSASIAKGPIVLRVFARNVTDTRPITQGLVAGDVYYPPAEAEQRILQPRTIGIGMDYAF